MALKKCHHRKIKAAIVTVVKTPFDCFNDVKSIGKSHSEEMTDFKIF